jgi:Coenzyme PQQ synthesis protein D (PqqD)
LASTTIAPAPDVLFCERSGEGMLLNLKSGRYFGLDAVGTRIWQLFLEGRSLDATVSQLLEEYDVTRDKLLTDVGAFVAALEKHGLVVRVPVTG